MTTTSWCCRAALSLDTEQAGPAQQRVAEYLEGAQLVASSGTNMPKTPAKGLPQPGAQLTAEQYEAAARLYAVVVSHGCLLWC